MWSLKFKIFDEESRTRQLIEKNKVAVYYYPINYYTKNKKYFFISAGIVKGKDKNIKSFLKELKDLKKVKKGRKVESLEINNNFMLLVTSHSISEETKKYVHTFYNPGIIHFKPVIFLGSGEEWEIASLEKKYLQKIIDVGKNVYDLKLLRFYWKKAKNFGFLTLLPELTEKQSDALNLANDSGYYQYPRKTSLDKLAKIAKVSFSTFQAHIRKAENKIIPFVLNLKK